jgi:ABC-type nitrate/sulfonate/bicarbonate transport system ATPase subunit
VTHDPKSAPGGTGTGPAGGVGKTPTPPSRDPAAEAAALAALEAEDSPAKVSSIPEPPAPAPPVAPAPVAAPAAAPKIEVKSVAPLGKPLAKPPVVMFDKVTKTYGKGSSAFTAIKDVSFEIPDYPGRGEFVSILGPSGCGKSTVIRMIAGLLPQFPQTSGRVLIDGKPIKGPGPDRGMVFQDYTSFDNRTVLENVAFGLECRGITRAIASVSRKQTVTQYTTHTAHDFSRGMKIAIQGVGDASFNGSFVVAATPAPNVFTVQQQGPDGHRGEGGTVTVPKLSGKERADRARYWIEKVGLSINRDSDKYPHQLSGGMRQRVAIARTLILEPRIILMDEPFGALDPPTRSRMQDNLVALWREQSPTIFFITHSIEEAVFLGDHILMFSTSPGTVLENIRVPPPDRPSIIMQRDPKFIEIVLGLREKIDHLESSQRAGD